MKDLKLQWIGEKPPAEERNPNLFYYDVRSADFGVGYTVERNVLVNHIGALVTNKDILGDKEFITDEELDDLEYDEVYDLYTKPNSIESDMEL